MLNPLFPLLPARKEFGPAPTQLMPLQTYRTEGAIGGIQQRNQFVPFSMKHNRSVPNIVVSPGVNGIQTGQFFDQPLIQSNDF